LLAWYDSNPFQQQRLVAVSGFLVKFGSAAVLLSSVLMARRVWAVDQRDISAVRGDMSRSLFGDGSGVRIGILDSGIDANHPAVRGSVIAAKDFSGSGTVNDENNGPGHATGIAAIYAGHEGSNYRGLAPGAGILNARVITSSDFTNDRWATEGFMWAVGNKAKVVNLSFGNRLGDGPLSNKFNMIVDYVSRRFGVSVVAAAGNDDETAVNQTPAGSYNGWGIGALQPSRYNQVASFSNYAQSGDKRTKPDIVAPGQSILRAAANWERGADYTIGSGTSFSTPIVGGALAQMIGFGQSRRLHTAPALLKAIMLTGAEKVWDYDGAPWTPRRSFSDPRDGRVFDAPLDDEQGAGRLDAVSAYRIYSKTRDTQNAVTDWWYGQMRKGRSLTLKLGNLKAGQRVDSTVAWYRQVGLRDNGNARIDVGDTYYEMSTLADFALTLLKDGKPVAMSDSNFDNVEHLSFRITADGNYSVQAFRFLEGGMKREPFGFAARVLNNAPVLRHLDEGVSQSFVDAGGVSSGVSRGLDLGLGGGGVVTAASVPEPSGGVIAIVLGAWVLVGRRRREWVGRSAR
jgi:subtilisin family serine protease